MISPEFEIFNTVAMALREAYPGIYVAGEYVDSPTSFPAVTIVEADNTVVQRMRTTRIENAASVMYEVNVYCNEVGTRKLQAKEIMSFIDDLFASMGLTRTMCNPIANLQDATIYRIVARYEGIVDQDFMIYQN